MAVSEFYSQMEMSILKLGHELVYNNVTLGGIKVDTMLLKISGMCSDFREHLCCAGGGGALGKQETQLAVGWWKADETITGALS